jgi:hypothetical protein
MLTRIILIAGLLSLTTTAASAQGIGPHQGGATVTSHAAPTPGAHASPNGAAKGAAPSERVGSKGAVHSGKPTVKSAPGKKAASKKGSAKGKSGTSGTSAGKSDSSAKKTSSATKEP